MRSKIAIIGGGVWVSSLLGHMAKQIFRGDLDLALAAREIDKLETIADFCRRERIAERPGWTVVASSVSDAIDGAEIVVLLQRYGGAHSRYLDETFPRQFGLPGDEGLGAGGFANALRTLPMLARLISDIKRRAPDAQVLNLVAPLGLTTRLVADYGLNAIGICELPVITEAKLRTSLPSRYRDAHLDYAGLNHIGWFYPTSHSVDIFAQWVHEQLVDAQVLDRYGAVPLHYVYRVYETAAAERMGLTPNPERAVHLDRLSKIALQDMKSGLANPPSLSGRATPWFELALVPILSTFLDDSSWRGFATVPAATDAEWYASGTHVETRVEIRGREVQQLPARREPPNEVGQFLREAIDVEESIYEIAISEPTISSVADVVRTAKHLESGAAEELAQSIVAAAMGVAEDVL